MDGDKESPRLTPIDKSRGYLGADNLVYEGLFKNQVGILYLITDTILQLMLSLRLKQRS
jgi:hypothetical protein